MIEKMKNKETLLDRAVRHWISALFFIGIFASYLVGTLLLHISEILQHILLTLTAVLGIHVLDRLFLYKDVQETLDSLVADVRSDISIQSESLLRMSKSLDSMDRCGIVQIYANRVDAAPDMRADLLDEANTKIRIMGISLNDFIQDIDHNLNSAWETLQQYVVGKKAISNGSKKLDIKILIIDPLSYGAALRSGSESEISSALSLRLDTDVNGAAKYLQKLESKQCGDKTGVTIECKLYRLPPIMFLCWMDSTCYTHQYHFWSSRDNKTPIPTYKYRKLTGNSETYPYHSELEHHFDWIWKHASISISDYLLGKAVGVDEGIHKTAAKNIYIDQIKARERITYLFDNAQHDVVIQGVSLKSYFETGSLREKISNLLDKEEVEITVLLLNPECEQAKYRSYRERLFEVPAQQYEPYLSSGEHLASELWLDTNQTMRRIRHMVSELKRKKGQNWHPKLTVAFYDTAPACFLLKIDGHMLVEQYHYGKIARGTKNILGKDMPLYEYTEEPDDLYKEAGDPLRMPFGLLDDHLKFVMRQAKSQDI